MDGTSTQATSAVASVGESIYVPPCAIPAELCIIGAPTDPTPADITAAFNVLHIDTSLESALFSAHA